MFFHLAPAADYESFPWLLDAVQRTVRQPLLLQEGDPVARHLAVADQDGLTRQCRQARTDKPGRLVLHAMGFAVAGERFVVTAAVVHGRFLG